MNREYVYPNDVEISLYDVKCPHCKKVYDTTIDGHDIYINAEYDEEPYPVAYVKCPHCGDGHYVSWGVH